MDSTGTLIISTIVLGIIGFLSRTAYMTIIKDIKELKSDSHRLVEEQGKLKGKLELLEQEHRLKYQLIQETTQQEIRTMATKIGDLSDMVGELVRVQINNRS